MVKEEEEVVVKKRKKERKKKTATRTMTTTVGLDGGRHGSECAVVSEVEKEEEDEVVENQSAGERATNKLPGRSQRQVKQRRRG